MTDLSDMPDDPDPWIGFRCSVLGVDTIRVFGTSADCDVRVDDKYASNHHCKVTMAGDGTVTVEDLGSTNGTWIRPVTQEKLGPFSLPGTRVYGPTPLHPGWIIRIGNTDLPWKKP